MSLKISDIHCNFEISDDQFCNKKDGSIKLCVSRDDEKFDDYFIEAGFEVDCTGLEPEYNFYKRYDNFKSFADDIDFLNEHLSKLPKNSIFLFDGYKKEVKKLLSSFDINYSIDNNLGSINFITDKRKYFKEAVRLGYPGETTEEKMKEIKFITGFSTYCSYRSVRLRRKEGTDLHHRQ